MESIIFIVKFFILGTSVIIALDDCDAQKSIKNILNNSEGKIKLRNDVLEALLATKGHHDSSVFWKRYLPVLLVSFTVVYIETYVNIDCISIAFSIIAIASTIVLKHICNEAYEMLKRNIKNGEYR